MSTPSADPTVSRITATDALAVLERVSSSDLMERGSVFVLSLDAIKDRTGARWPRRRDDVWGYLNRKLNEYLSYQDIYHPISETDMLVAMTTEEGVAAQAVGLKVLEEVLEFFLGAAEQIDIRIKAVNRIEGGELSCTELDPKAIAVAREKEATDPYRRDVSPEMQRERNPVSFVASNGHRLRIDFALEHIVSLRHGVTAVLRVEPTVRFAATGELIPTRRFMKLCDQDMLAIDKASLAFAALFLPQDARVQPPVILPASFRTMGGRKGRDLLITVDGATPERVRHGAMLEFIDVDRGTPEGRLIEVSGLVSRLCRGVLCRLHPARDPIEPVKGARFNGLTLDLAEMRIPDAKMKQLLQLMAHLMRGKAPALIAQGLPDLRHMEMAHKCGFTHAGLRAEPLTAGAREVA